MSGVVSRQLAEIPQVISKHNHQKINFIGQFPLTLSVKSLYWKCKCKYLKNYNFFSIVDWRDVFFQLEMTGRFQLNGRENSLLCRVPAENHLSDDRSNWHRVPKDLRWTQDWEWRRGTQETETASGESLGLSKCRIKSWIVACGITLTLLSTRTVLYQHQQYFKWIIGWIWFTKLYMYQTVQIVDRGRKIAIIYR